jgi:2',3'-cyclic-nucleotide 2'-phosphodiesterase/3'-nucleotidase
VEGDTILLLNSGKDAHLIAALDVVFDQEGRAKLEASLVDADRYEPDEKYMKTFAPHVEKINDYVNRTIGTSDCSAAARDALWGPSVFMDFVHQMQLDISGAKISFAAPLACDYVFPEGEVKVRDIYSLYPYENNLYVLWLTGREIKDYLEMSYGMWTSQMTSPKDHLLLLDDTGDRLMYPYFYFDSAAGIIYEVDVTKPIGKRVTIDSMADGTPFDMSKRYMVAMNSYRANGGGGLITEGANITHEELQERIEYTTTADLRFYMINYIEMRKNISPEPLNQWRFVPERWTVNAGARDRNLLFGEE